MMLTTKSRYAIMAILELASNDSSVPMKLSDISINQDIPLAYLEQIFIKLKKANLVTSIKGPGGGYLMGDNINNITIFDIINAVDENIRMTRCSEDKKCVELPKGIKCQTHNLWKGLTAQIKNYFSGISVKDVLKGHINL